MHAGKMMVWVLVIYEPSAPPALSARRAFFAAFAAAALAFFAAAY